MFGLEHALSSQDVFYITNAWYPCHRAQGSSCHSLTFEPDQTAPYHFPPAFLSCRTELTSQGRLPSTAKKDVYSILTSTFIFLVNFTSILISFVPYIYLSLALTFFFFFFFLSFDFSFATPAPFSFLHTSHKFPTDEDLPTSKWLKRAKLPPALVIGPLCTSLSQ